MQVKAAPGFARPAWLVMPDLLSAFGDASMTIRQPSDVFTALAAARPEFAGMSYDTLGMKGALVAGTRAGASA
jgi:predicted molibdopterin-dependent oxidoreductase YjgC